MGSPVDGADFALEQLRAKLRGSGPLPPVPARFEYPAPEKFDHGISVMAFDPSLMHTGFVMVHWPLGCPNPIFWARRTLDIKTSYKGYWATWDAAHKLQRELQEIFKGCWGDLCALEAPAIGGGNLRRTDSSLIAGTVIYGEAAGRGIQVQEVSPNHVSSVLTGNVRHDKREIAAAVQHYWPQAESWTEAECDAAAVGLTKLHDVRTARS